jgi:peptidoglycan hydrolase-like protein with peptidoglycan-binding domain
MNKIIPPIRLQDQGPAVANFQEALLFIVEKRQLTPGNLTLAQWRQNTASEMAAQSFGPNTRRLFAGVLTALSLPNADFVDEPTAARLNQILETLGAFPPPLPPPSDGFPLTLGTRGPNVADLQKNLQQLGYLISVRESAAELFGDTTLRAVGTFLQSRGLEPNGEIDQALAAQIRTAASVNRNEPQVVLGVVRRSDSTAVEHAVVRAFDADFRSEELLGEDITDSEGRYSIAYSAEQFARIEKGAADLFVRVFDATGQRIEAVSPITFQAARAMVIDVLLEDGRRRSEYERHMALLEQLAPNVSPAEFTTEDLRFLIGETGIGARILAFLCVAHKHARATGVQAPAFYGQFRQNAPTNLTAFLLRSLPVQRAALERSINDVIIPAELATNLGEILAQLQRARGNHVLTDSADATSPLGGLLISSGVSSSSREKFLNLYFEHTGRIEDFWNSLASTEEIPRSDVEALRFTLQLALLTRNNLPLVKLLSGESRSMRDLVHLNTEDWIARIRTAHTGGIPLPPDLPGDTDESRISAYAGEILELLQDALPMDYLRQGVEQDLALPTQRRTDLITFLNRAPQFDLLEMPVDQFLSANEPLLEGIADRQGFTTELKSMQRVFRLTQRYGATKALRSKGWDSALLIAETPFSRFLESVGDDLGGVDKTAKYYKTSQHTAAFTANTYATIYQYQNGLWPAAVGEQKPHTLDGLPNWEQLFGSVDFCECKHCRSVYGPAAYFVDLLQFLRRDGAPFTELMKRRPDLEHLKLTCENTNTPLPYVDLVNEIMEFFVLNGAFEMMSLADKAQKALSLAKDTGAATAEELSVNPQYLDPDAYEPLSQAVFSFRLPFNRPVETARVYLEHLGSSLHEVMSVFQNTADPTQKNPDSRSLAREYLKITPEEFTILTGQSSGLARAFFGYVTDNVVHKQKEDDGSVTELTESWRANVARVPEFLRRTGVPFSDVVDLLKTRFINPVQPPEQLPPQTVVLFSPNAVCDLNQTWIQRLDSDHDHLESTGLDDSAWLRIHRFLRLWNKLEWTQQELDRTIIALSSTNIDAALIEDLSRLAWLRAKLNQPIIRLLSLWAPIDTFGDDALYVKLFQNKAITNPLDTALALNQQGTDLADTTALITEHAATLQAALRINADDLALLRDATELAADTETLTLAKISNLYRHALLAKSLKLKVREFLALKVLVGVDLFNDPASTVAFVERARGAKASPFTIAELNYLFRHVSDPGKGPAPAEDATIILLEALQKDLLKIVADTEPVTDPTSDILRSKLALVLQAPDVDIAMGIIEGTSALSLVQQEQFIDDQFEVFLDPADAKAALLPPPDPDDEEAKQARRTFVLTPLLSHLRDVLSRSVVKQTLTSALPLEANLVQFLLEELLAARSDPSQNAIADFLALGQSAAPADRLPDFIRLHKIALLLGRFEATPEETAYISAHSADFGNFDLNGMPLDRTDPSAVDVNAASLFTQWEHLRDFFALRERLPQADLTLLDVMAAPSTAEGRATLSVLTGWDASDIDFLCSDGGIGVPDDALKNATGPERLFTAFTLSRKLGTSVKQLCQWAQQPLTAVIAQDIIHAVKAKYDDEQWLSAAKLLNDDLREKRKLALIAYLLTHKDIVDHGITESNGLYEYFLIDVNMDPCMMTSRIKQAISSVQLFIQRSLINLETGPTLSPESAQRWSWMKNYRLWEANRKVFLYPENWIEPDLRDDKSPFFKDLETHLLQNDLTPDNVEQALMSYLEKLDDVGRLEACGMCREKAAADGVDRVHIFARTFNVPYLYFYRRYNAIRNRWSPWERVPVDIEGDHLIPVVWNRRLHLFWPVFVEKPDIDMTKTYLPEGLDPLNRWEIKLAWSEYRQGRWTPKQTSSGTIFSPVLVDPDSWENTLGESWKDGSFYSVRQQEHYFRASVQDDRLRIACYRRYDAQADFHVEWQVGSSEYTLSKPGAWGIFKDHERVGLFEFTGCRGRADINDADFSLEEGFDSLREPKDTFNTDMAFVSSLGADELAFQDNKATDVLRDVDPPFRFLPPQEISDLGDTFYPFVFQDPRRAYFAMPTLDDFRAVREVFTNPFLEAAADIENALGSIPLADQGHPVPPSFQFSFHKSHSSFNGTFSGAHASFPSMRLMKGASGSTLLVRDERTTTGRVVVQELAAPSQVVMKKTAKAGGFQQAGDDANELTVQEQLKLKKMYLKFHIFFHPHVCEFIKTLNHLGVPGLLILGSQEIDNDPQTGTNFNKEDTVFDNVYDPAPIVHDDYPQEDVDFRPEGAYSLYNWEFFFHGPLLIADRLSKSQRFEDAMKWFHYIFDPTNNSADDAPKKYWRFLPFYENDENGRVEELLETLNHGTPSEKKKLAQLVEDWRDNPFNPHLIARSRMIAYQKTVVMKYLENLINWGDQLFARDTIESINEATQLYVLAYHLLGRRPEQIPPRLKPKDQTYSDLKPFLDGFSNAMIDLENAFPFTSVEEAVSSQDMGAENFGTALAFYFCIPPNDKLLSYWDTVEDRLFKVRHCMNIEGVVRELPLFEPPIDPALLVKAAAAGLDLSSVLADIQAPLTPYRFQFLSQQATELCAEVKSLGQELLSVLEKKDAEVLSALRAGHETVVLETVREAKRQQVHEARRQLEAVEKTRKVIEERQVFYQQRLAQLLNKEEQTQLDKLYEAHRKQSQAATMELGAKALSLVPTIAAGGAGSMGSPLTSVSFGGPHLAFAAQAFAHMYSDEAADATYEATANAIRGGHARRSEEWKLQLTLATRELVQIDKQIAAAEIRIAIAENDLSTHDKQIENAKAVEEFLRSKYTNEELYRWMLSQISAVYFQSYKLAYDMAKRAERAFRFERAVTESSFIQFGYWDSFTKGLLAGEKLLLDLKRMEVTYIEQNRREHEITKHVSLMLHDPLKLIQLKETGRCEVELAEVLFDADFPGHYMRRIKSASLTIPCIIGPYTSVNCTLTLLSNQARIKSVPAQPYKESENNDVADNRFVRNFAAIQSIVTSHAQNDSGLFELNFRDERYLPFEGAGAISRWRIELAQEKDLRQFDYDTISDVVLHLKYTARDGGGVLRTAATGALKALPAESEEAPLPRLFSARHEFGSEWYKFLRPLEAESNHILKLELIRERFPFAFRNRQLTLNEMELFLKFKDKVIPPPPGPLLNVFVRGPETDETAETDSLPGGVFSSLPNQYAGLPHVSGITLDQDLFGNWQIEVQKIDAQTLLSSLKQVVSDSNAAEEQLTDLVAALEDIYIVCHYAVGDQVA